MDELIKDFIEESKENLDRLDQEFVKLESNPGDRELLKSIFRTIHTIKGTCGFLGFSKLEALTHAGESLLSLLRDGEMNLTEECADALLAMVDAVRGYLREIEATGLEGDAEGTELIGKLKKLQSGATNANAPAATIPPVVAPPVPTVTAPDTPKEVAAETNGSTPTGKRNAAPAKEIEKKAKAKAEEPKPKKAKEEPAAAPTRESKPEESKDATIRVDVNLLEKQMNLVSELVLLRNRLLQLAVESNERNLNATVHGLNYVTSELRKNVMKTRMQPVSQLFDKLPRIVRDVSKDMGKKVRLETQGGETELDKSLLEAIKDPVTHILRNSIDHGIETPEKRQSQGKAEEGTVRIRAFHEGGNFHLELTDDGAGIDAERVKRKGVEKGLISAASAEKMAESDALNLIFLPGLSTAEKVTNVSGRGVGMDVVKTNIDRIGGRVKLESARGKGTTVWLEIPLTLATIPALTVVSGNSVFAIPQAALVEMIGLDAEGAKKYIESIDGVSVFRFRGTVLPLISLREELKLKANEQRNQDVIKLVIVRTEGRQVALRVDAIRNTEEIVIKPLDKRFKSIALYSGAAVLGDGRVALILDVPAFVRRAGVIAEKEAEAKQGEEQKQKEKVSLLLLGGSDGERLAVPLEYVQRLEEFAESAKESMGELTVVQYRKGILPIFHLESLLDERRMARRTAEGNSASAEKVSAFVVRLGESSNIILEVHRILGIAKVEIDKLTPPSRAGVRGSMVIQERVTEILDLPALLKKTPTLEESAMELAGAGTES